MKRTRFIAVCIAFAFALVLLAGCGDQEDNTEKTTAQKAEKQTTSTASAEKKAKKSAEPEEDGYTGVIVDNCYEKFTLGLASGNVELTTNDKTQFNFGDNSYMFVGDVVHVDYEEKGGKIIAKQIDLLEEPEPGALLGDYAANLCWPHGQMSDGRYDGGSMTKAYARLYDALKPQNESGINSRQWRAGASCDLFVATALRGFGLTDFPVTLSDQCNYFFISKKYKDAFEKIDTGGDPSKMQHGDVGIYIKKGSGNNGQGHIFIVDKAGGHDWKSNAHYKVDNGYYGVIDDLKDHYDPDHYKYFGMFRLK